MNTKDNIMSELDSQAVKSWRGVMKCYREVFSYLESTLNKENCSYSKFEILLTLYTEGQKSPSQIADTLAVTRGNISSFLQRLLKEELVERTKPRPESKRWEYRLSEKGHGLIERVASGQNDIIKNLFKPLDHDAMQVLSSTATKARELNVAKLHKTHS